MYKYKVKRFFHKITKVQIEKEDDEFVWIGKVLVFKNGWDVKYFNTFEEAKSGLYKFTLESIDQLKEEIKPLEKELVKAQKLLLEILDMEEKEND